MRFLDLRISNGIEGILDAEYPSIPQCYVKIELKKCLVNLMYTNRWSQVDLASKYRSLYKAMYLEMEAVKARFNESLFVNEEYLVANGAQFHSTRHFFNRKVSMFQTKFLKERHRPRSCKRRMKNPPEPYPFLTHEISVFWCINLPLRPFSF